MTSFTSQKLYTDTLLSANGIQLSKIGSDTVVLYDTKTDVVYICGHFKEFKMSSHLGSKEVLDCYSLSSQKMKMEPWFDMGKQDMKFINQMVELNKLFAFFHDKECIVMCDANTQVVQGSSSSRTLDFYEKETLRFQTFEFDYDVFVSNKTTQDLQIKTTDKMRGTHTSQLNKSFQNSMCNIDYVIYKPRQSDTVEMVSKAYMLQPDHQFKEKSVEELTTAPYYIPDHAPVITKINNATCVGTFNIKGGDTEDSSWAEFVPEQYKSFFLHNSVQIKINSFLLVAFKTLPEVECLASNEERLKRIKSKNFVSEHRFSICEMHLHPDMVPYIETKEDNSFVAYFLTNDKEIMTECTFCYNSPIFTVEIVEHIPNEIVKKEVNKWTKILLKDLNQATNQQVRIDYFLSKVSKLLNFYYYVEKDTINLKDKLSFYDVYTEWFSQNEEKMSVVNMLGVLKSIRPELTHVALQEFPVDKCLADALVHELNLIGNVYINKEPFVIDNKQCATQGAIFVYS